MHSPDVVLPLERPFTEFSLGTSEAKSVLLAGLGWMGERVLHAPREHKLGALAAGKKILKNSLMRILARISCTCLR